VQSKVFGVWKDGKATAFFLVGVLVPVFKRQWLRAEKQLSQGSVSECFYSHIQARSHFTAAWTFASETVCL